jgi:hypothetical protein
MAEEAYFRSEGGAYFANPVSAGPWRSQSLMGRCLCGLFGHEIERRHLEPGFIPARFTVELFDLSDFSAITVETRVMRDGRRARLIDAELFCDGQSRARARCQLLHYTEAPGGKVWSPPNWDVPAPDGLAQDPTRTKWWFRPTPGPAGGPRRAWMRDYRELVEGVPLSPFAQAALCADFSSPFSHMGDAGLQYINTEATLYLHRLPQGGWIGFEAADHQATDGVAVGHTRIYDLRGPIGFGSACALAQRMRRPG